MSPQSVCVAVICLCAPIILLGQSGRHSRSGSGNNQGSSTAPADNPDLTDFKRAVALEATADQQSEFNLLASDTDAARQLAEAIQKAAHDDTVKQSTALQNSLDEVQRQDRKFLNTFSDAQTSGLKKQAKKLTQSDAGLSKEAKKLSAQLEKIPPDPQRLQQIAEHLEHALVMLQSDQNELADEMGIGVR